MNMGYVGILKLRNGSVLVVNDLDERLYAEDGTNAEFHDVKGNFVKMKKIDRIEVSGLITIYPDAEVDKMGFRPSPCVSLPLGAKIVLSREMVKSFTESKYGYTRNVLKGEGFK
jgi:hypothetical protein